MGLPFLNTKKMTTLIMAKNKLSDAVPVAEEPVLDTDMLGGDVLNAIQAKDASQLGRALAAFIQSMQGEQE